MKLVLPEGTSLGELLGNYHIPADAVGLLAVNGSLVKTDRILQDQDNVQLYPPLEGG
jgi:sulfur carrier protein ThiS